MELNSLAIISHEFKMPIATIRGGVEVLRRYLIVGRIDEIDTATYMKSMQRNCNILARLTSNLIALSQKELSAIYMDYSCVDFCKLIEDLIKTAKETLEASKINYIKKIEEAYIVCDIEKIEKVFFNLISNTVRYAGKDAEIEIIIQSNDSVLEVIYSDNGPGIPKELSEKIFEPFVRINNESTNVVSGSGLGLAIVRKFMNLHNGEVKLTTDTGEGCVFNLKFPLDDQNDLSFTQNAPTNRDLNATAEIEFSTIL
ncbi:MAG: HAMP domain-containing histidine kinase [Clostridiales bacterium]|jgi:signal transduction histidine kinase|nr:HAMP domain-containing histidine kinase [Clostridiales bacterium]